jgi:hypothetical protein
MSKDWIVDLLGKDIAKAVAGTSARGDMVTFTFKDGRMPVVRRVEGGIPKAPAAKKKAPAKKQAAPKKG